MKTKEQVWEEACKATLKSISETFLSEKYQSIIKGGTEKIVINAIGNRIIHFPIPEFPNATKTIKK